MSDRQYENGEPDGRMHPDDDGYIDRFLEETFGELDDGMSVGDAEMPDFEDVVGGVQIDAEGYVTGLHSASIASISGTGPRSPNPFRKRYRALSEDELDLHDRIKDTAGELLELFDELREVTGPAGHIVERSEHERYLALARTDLETAVMWAVKAGTL